MPASRVAKVLAVAAEPARGSDLPPEGPALDARRFLRNVGSTLAARGLLVAVAFGTSILLARGLGAAGRGEYAVATAVSSIGIQLASLGMHTSSAWFVARDPRQLGRLLVNGLVVGSVVGGGLAVLVGLAATAFPSLAPIPTILVLLSLVAIPFGLANLVVLNLTLGLDRIRDFNALELGQRVLAAGAIVVVLLAGAVTSTAAFAGVLLATIIVTTAGIWLLARRWQRNSPGPQLAEGNCNIRTEVLPGSSVHVPGPPRRRDHRPEDAR